MADYKTKAITVGDVTATISKAGPTAAEKVKALVEFISEAIVDPGYGVGGGGAHPDQGLPSGGKPSTQPVPPASGGQPSTKPGTDDPEAGQLPSYVNDLAAFLKSKAKEIAAEALKGTLCDPAKPK